MCFRLLFSLAPNKFGAIFRNNRFTSKSGIPGPTAARFTRILLDKELLRTLEESLGRRPALYAFEPLLQLARV